MTLHYDFALYSPGSRRLVDYDEADGDHPGFAAPDGGLCLGEEIARTAREAARAAPHRIDRGTLTRAEADRICLVLAAIAADLAAERTHLAACRAHFAAGGDWRELPDHPGLSAEAPPGAKVGWEEKLHVLRRELHFRRRYDPDRVARGRTTAAAAREQLERLEAVHEKYWRHMFTWTSPTGAATGSPAWRAEIREHSAKLDLASSAEASANADPSPVIPAKAGTHEHGTDQEALPV